MKEINLHPLMGLEELDRLVWKLAEHHGYHPDQNAIVFREEKSLLRVDLRIHHKNLYPETLFDCKSKDFPLRVIQLPGYPFSLAIGWLHYNAYFRPDYPHPVQLPVAITFIYHVFQLLTTGGLLVILTSQNQDGWPLGEIGKIAEKIDQYVLPPVFKHRTSKSFTVYPGKKVYPR